MFIATTSLEFFGSQDFALNITSAPLRELSKERLEQIHRHGPPADLANVVTAFDSDNLPMNDLETVYLSLERARVKAIIVLNAWVAEPGFLHFWHDGSAGKFTRYGQVPIVEAAAADVRPLLEDGQTVSMLTLDVRRGPRGRLNVLARSECRMERGRHRFASRR